MMSPFWTPSSRKSDIVSTHDTKSVYLHASYIHGTFTVNLRVNSVLAEHIGICIIIPVRKVNVRGNLLEEESMQRSII